MTWNSAFLDPEIVAYKSLSEPFLELDVGIPGPHFILFMEPTWFINPWSEPDIKKLFDFALIKQA